MGYDAEYDKDASDNELLARASREGRILLTSDVELYRRAVSSGLRAVLIRGLNEAERLAELAAALGIRLHVDMTRSRCPKCNSPVVEVPKESVKELVPEGSWRRYDRFWRCTGCGQVYWQGSHWTNIENVLARAREIARKAGKGAGNK